LGDAISIRGVLQRDAGEAHAALASFDETIGRLDAFRAEHGTDMDLRKVLSMCYHSRGILLRNLDQTEEAQQAFAAAIGIRQSLTRDYPSMPEGWIELATSYNSLGILHWRADELDEAMHYYGLAVEQQRRLVDDHPEIPLYRSDLAANHNNVAIVHRQRGEFKEAVAVYEEVIRLRKQLIEETPDFVPNQTALGSVYRNVGRVYDAQGDFLKMLEWCNRSVDTLTPLYDRIGDDPRVRYQLRRAHWDRAEALLELNRPADAIEAWSEAWKFDDGPERDFIAMQRALARALDGDHEAAANEAEQLCAGELDGETTFDAARVYSLSVAAAVDDRELTNEERESLIANYGRRAVEMLVLCKQRGYLNRPEDQEMLNNEMDLKAIRQRADYGEFIDKQ
jgi:tetratricopeptide (TPR) repeat protein